MDFDDIFLYKPLLKSTHAVYLVYYLFGKIIVILHA
jgi:hypothetical protein